jgi:hypothetical protein
MISPIASYKYYVNKYGLVGAQKHVYEFFTEKYFKASNNSANVAIVKKLPFFVPGRIYTYKYDPKYKDVLAWYDERPLMLSIRHFKAESTGNLIETGINLNFIPPQMRVLILQSLYNVYHPIMEANNMLDNKKRSGKQRALFTESYDYMGVLDWIFDMVSKTAYRFAIRNYIKQRVYYPKAISYSDFGKCALLLTKDTVGASLDDIFKEYWDYKIQANKRKTILSEHNKKYMKRRVKKDISKMRKRK